MMPRANRYGVPGLSKLSKGPLMGRWRLSFRYVDPLTGEKSRIVRLYPADGWTATMVKADAGRRVRGAMDLKSARERAAEAEASARHSPSIAEIAPEVVKLRERQGGAPATLFEFRSVVLGDSTPGRRGRKGGGAIVRHLGKRTCGELSSPVLEGFERAMLAEGRAVSTVRNAIKVLGVFVKLVRRAGLDPNLRENPIAAARDLGWKTPTERRRRIVTISTGDAGALLSSDEIPEARRLLYAVACLSGLRAGEIAALAWDAVDLDQGIVHVRASLSPRGGMKETKTEASERDVPIHRYLGPWLARWRDAHKGAVYVFPGGRTSKIAALLRRDLARVEAPTEGVTLHALRRSFCTWLEAAGVPHEQIERLVGHAPRSVLGQHYAAGSLDVLREAVDRVSVTVGSRVRVAA